MNEKLKELADQAWKCAEHPIIPRDFDMGIFEKKFAELIVRDCINICISNRDDDSADHIEKHFGEEMNISLGIRLVKKEVKLHPDTFAPELEITVRIPLVLEEQVVPDPEIETKIGKEILTLLGHNV